MTISEIILIIIAIAIFAGIHFGLKKIKKPYQNYIRIGSAIALLLLAWVFGGDGGMSYKLILSAVAISSIYKEYLSLRKPQPNS